MLFQVKQTFPNMPEDGEPKVPAIALEADPDTIPATEHDRLMGWVSHLPQLTANALALALMGLFLILPAEVHPQGVPTLEVLELVYQQKSSIHQSALQAWEIQDRSYRDCTQRGAIRPPWRKC